MSNKRMNKRLNKLFEDIAAPEESNSTTEPPKKKTPKPSKPRAPKVVETHLDQAKASASPIESKTSPAPRRMPETALAQTAVYEADASSLSLAFQSGEQTWSSLQIVDDKPRNWNQDEQLLVKQVVDQLTLALQNANLFQQTQRRAAELAVLNEMSGALSSLLNEKSIAEAIFQYTSRLMNTDSFFIALYDDERKMMHIPLATVDGERIQIPERPLGKGLSDYIIRHGEALWFPNNVVEHMKAIGIDFIPIGNAKPALSWLGVPLLIENRPIGVITVQSVHQSNLYSENDRDILTAIAGQAAIALQNARLFTETQQSEVRFRALIENAPEAILIVNTQNAKFEEPNENAEKLYGYKRDDLVKYGPADLSPEYQPSGRLSSDAALEQISRALKGEIAIFEWMHINASGGFIPCEIRLVQLPDRPHLIRATVTDITERKAAEEAIRYRAEVEALLSDISTAFVSTDVDHTSEEIQHTVTKLGRFLGIDRCYVFQYSEDLAINNCTHEWCAKGIEPEIDKLQNIPIDPNSWWTRQILRGDTIRVANIADIPAEAEQLKQSFMTQGIQSILAEPIVSGHIVLGYLGMDAVAAPQKWTDQTINLSQLVAQTLSSAIVRQQAQEAERKSRDALARRASELQGVAEITTATSTILNPNLLIQTVVNLTTRRLGLYHSHIFRLQEDNQTLKVIACGWNEKFPHTGTHEAHTISITQEISLVARAARSRQPIFVNDVRADKGWLPNAILPDVQSEAAIPLVAGNELLGVLNVHSNQINAYSDEDIAIFTTLATQIATAIQNAGLFAETQRRASEMATLNQIVRAVAQEIELKSVLKAAYEQIGRLIPVDAFIVGILNENTNLVDFPLIIDGDEYFTEPSIPLSAESNTGRTILTGTHTLINVDPKEYETEEIAPNQLLGNKSKASASLLYVPLNLGQRTIGTLSVQSYKFNAYTQESVDLLINIANQLSIGIQNARLFTETQRRATEVAVLAEIANDIATTLEVEPVLTRIAEQTRRLLNARDIAFYIQDKPNVLRASIAIGAYTKQMQDDTIEFGEGVTGSIALSGVAEIINDLLADPRGVTIEGTPEGEDEVMMSAPMISRNKIIGVVNVWRRKEDGLFEQGDLDFLISIARQAAIAIESGRLFQETRASEEAMRRQNEYLSTAANVGRLVTSTLELKTLYTRAAEMIHASFGYYHVFIFIIDENGFNAVVQEGTGEVGAQLTAQGFSVAVGSRSVVGTVTATGKTIVVNNTAIDPLYKPHAFLTETRAEACIPLRATGGVIGVLDLQATQVDAFTPDDIAVLETLAGQIAVAIDNARSYNLAQKAIEEMRELDKIKSQFLANMSHELRTPLNSIIGFSRVILKGIDGPVTDQQHQDLSAIYSSGQHLLSLINDILDLSKIEAGKMELATEEITVTDTIQSVMSTALGLVKDKPIKLKQQIDPNLPTVRADPMRMRQVLLNLVSNASKFTEEGAIVVSAAPHTTSEGRHEVMISVTDSGPGISAEDQKKLFLAFSQVDSSPTRKSGGTGLGLSICQRLVELHGGRIGVHSTVGKGSTFYFTIPVFHEANPEEESAQDSDAKTILCIDDDPQVISLYERYLKPQGYNVVALTKPAHALAKAKEIKPYAITLDIMMPEIDGWTVLQQLKADTDTRHIPVIVCSIVEESEKGFSLGAADYLNKPILEEDFLSAINGLNRDGSITHVLLIDDDENDLRLFEKILKEKDLGVTIAKGGRAGWQAILDSTPSAIVLDLFMPDLDGFTILERLRTDPKLRDIPVVVISGVDLNSDQQKLLSNLGQRLLQKGSLNESELLSTLEKALKRLEGK
jgi:PAS domain S-box-containing protein